MKLRFNNFRRLGADYPDPVALPDNLKRKPAILSALEFVNALGGLFLILQGFLQFNAGDTSAAVGCAFLGGVLFACAWATAMDKFWFRRVIGLTYSLIVIGLLLSGVRTGSIILLLLAVVVAGVCLAIFLYRPIVCYHRWTKEISNS